MLPTPLSSERLTSLIERKLRQAMRSADIEPLPIHPEGRYCPSPTIFDLARRFRNVERYKVTLGDEITIFLAEPTEIRKQVLKLLTTAEEILLTRIPHCRTGRGARWRAGFSRQA